MVELEYKDGRYSCFELADAFNNDFPKEKDMCDYIESNISDFVVECLGYELKTYTREYPLVDGYNRNKKSNRRLDFMIETKCGKVIALECKNPTFLAEHATAIGQALTYMTLFANLNKRIDQLFIVSSKMDNTVPMVIDRFNLPIGFMVLDKSKHATFVEYGSANR